VTDTPTLTPTPTITDTPSPTHTLTFTPTITPTPTPDPNCPEAPLDGCKQPLAANKALLLIKDKGGQRDKLVWKWTKGDATTSTDFGDPVKGGTEYTLCVYGQAAPPNWRCRRAGGRYLRLPAVLEQQQQGSRTAIRPPLPTASRRSPQVRRGRQGEDHRQGAATLDPHPPLSQDPQVVVQLKNTS
jgi:hypothetical protein